MKPRHAARARTHRTRSHALARETQPIHLAIPRPPPCSWCAVLWQMVKEPTTDELSAQPEYLTEEAVTQQ